MASHAVVRGLGILALGAAVAAVGAGLAKAANRGKKPPAANPYLKAQQAAAASQANAAAKQAANAQKGSQQALKNATGTNAQITAAKEAVEQGERDLTKLEKQIEDEQPADSEFGKVRDAYHALLEKGKKLNDSILQSEEYKTKYAEAEAAAERGVAILAVRKQFIDENSEVQSVRADLKTTKAKYDSLRLALYAKDSKWTAASDELKKKRQELASLSGKFGSALSASNRLSAEAKHAKATAAVEGAAAAAAGAAAREKALKKRQEHGGK